MSTHHPDGGRARPERGAPSGRLFGVWDVAVAMTTLGIVLAMSWPAAAALRHQIAVRRQQLQTTASQVRSLKALGDFQRLRRQDLLQYRRTATRLINAVASQPQTPWTVAITEISRQRPPGLWATAIHGFGTDFKIRVAAERSDLVNDYVERLGMSPLVRQVGIPAALRGGNAVAIHGSFGGSD